MLEMTPKIPDFLDKMVILLSGRHVCQEMMMATWSLNKKLCFVLVECQFGCKHPFLNILDTLRQFINSRDHWITHNLQVIIAHRLDIHGERLWANYRALRNTANEWCNIWVSPHLCEHDSNFARDRIETIAKQCQLCQIVSEINWV